MFDLTYYIVIDWLISYRLIVKIQSQTVHDIRFREFKVYNLHRQKKKLHNLSVAYFS